MKILHIIAGSGQGGAETFCLDAIEALDDAGIRQHVICRPHGHMIETLQRRNIYFDTMAFSLLDRFGRGSAMIRKAVNSFKPDLAHAWMGRAASFVPKNLPVPVLGWFGGYYDLKRYRNCDFYMGVTRDIVRHIGEKSGRPDRAFLGHTFGTLTPEPPVDRATLNTPANAPVVLLLSRMHEKKGVDTLLRAAAKLDGVYFWLAGDGPEIETYRQLAKKLNLDGRVRFLGWRHDRAALLGAADICVLPSRYEPFGTVIAEAWHMNVPLVATRAAGASQYVTDREDGLLCAIDDIDGLAKQLHDAITDHALREKLIANGAKTYTSLFSKDTVIRSLLETYKKIVAPGKAGPQPAPSSIRTA